jgi:polar amino acid transport system substrate-binding protein
VAFRFQPWKRGEDKVENGTFFGTFPYLRTHLRSERFDFSDPVIYFFPKFFYMKATFPDGFSWQKIEDFKAYVIGGVLGYWYEKSFMDAGLQVQYVATDQQNIGKLMLGRIHFSLIDELVGWRLIQKAFPDQVDAFAVAEKPESSDAFRLMISRKYPKAKELTEKFNAGLQTILQNGIYFEILEKYGVSMEYAAKL